MLGKNSFDLIDQKSDENGCILIIEAKINEYNFIVINIYNSNTESELLKTFSILQNMLDDIEISNEEIVFGGDFSLIFDCKLETNCKNQVLKKRSLAKLVEINESLNPWDTWGIPNPQKKNKKKRYIIDQNQVSGFNQRRQSYFFVSNTLQYFVKKTDVLHFSPLTIHQFFLI